MDFNAQSNIAAAKMLDRKPASREHITMMRLAGMPIYTNDVDIFNNPADCLAVVKALGDFDVYLWKDASGEWVAEKEDESCLARHSYEQAVGAACIAVMENPDA